MFAVRCPPQKRGWKEAEPQGRIQAQHSTVDGVPRRPEIRCAAVGIEEGGDLGWIREGGQGPKDRETGDQGQKYPGSLNAVLGPSPPEQAGSIEEKEDESILEVRQWISEPIPCGRDEESHQERCKQKTRECVDGLEARGIQSGPSSDREQREHSKVGYPRDTQTKDEHSKDSQSDNQRRAQVEVH